MSAAQYSTYGYSPYVAARGISRYGSRRDDSKFLGVGLYQIHANSKNLHRNNWLARSIENCSTTYMTLPMPIGGEAMAQKIWLSWWDHAGISGACLDDVYTQVVSQQVVIGDSLVVFASDPNSQTLVKSRLQVIDASRVRTPDDLIEGKSIRGNAVIHGVEINAFGVEVGYHVCKTKDGEYLLGDSSNFIFYPRHDKDTGRPIARLLRRPDSISPSSTRGLPSITSIMPEIEDLGDLQTAAIQSAYAKAMLSVILTSPNPTALQGSLSVTLDENGQPLNTPSGMVGGLESGSVVTAPPGTQANVINASGNVDLVALITESLRHVSGSLGIPLEILMSNFSNINFSSSKNSFDKYLRQLQRWTDSNANYLTEIYRWVVLEGMLAMGLSPLEPHFQISWSPISLPSANPQQEAMAQQILLQNGLETRSGLLAKKGVSYKDHLVTLRNEETLEMEILGKRLEYATPNGDKVQAPDAQDPTDTIPPQQGQ